MEPEVRAMSATARRGCMVNTLDDELAARCRAGDLEAFATVFDRCERPVFRFAYHLLGSRDDADDAKQETFLRAWRTVGSFRGECSIHVWLLRICANICRDRLKSRRGGPEVSLDASALPEVADSSDCDPHGALERAAVSQALWRAIRGLPPTHREIIVLREIEELSYEEVAAALRCSVSSVKVRLFRARCLLKDRLTSLMEETR